LEKRVHTINLPSNVKDESRYAYLRVGIDFERYTLSVEGRDFGNCVENENWGRTISLPLLSQSTGHARRTVVVLALSLLLLKLEGDTANGSLLNTLHEMGSETSNLVAETLRGDDGNLVADLLVGVAMRHLLVSRIKKQN